MEISMRKNIYRLMAAVLAGALTMGMLGCNKEEEPSESPKEAVEVEQAKDDVVDGMIVNDAVMLTIGKTDVTYSEVMVYVNMIKDKYEPLFSEYIWDFEVGKDKSFQDLAKEEIINQIIRLKIMKNVASEEGIRLTEDEKLEIEDSAAEYLTKISEEQQKRYGINIDVVTTIYEDNFIAQKLFDVITSDVDTNVSKEEAYTVIVKQFAALYEGRDKEGNIIKKSDAQINKAKEEVSKAYEQIIKNKNDFQAYALSHSDLDAVVVSISKGELNDKAQEAIFALKEGEKSVVLDLGDGFYLFECVAVDDEKATKERIDEIVKERQNEMFAKEYDNWLQDTKVYIVTNLWNMINF